MGFLTRTPEVFKMLKEDHRKVERIFDAIEKESEPQKKSDLVVQALNELDIHMTLEEEIVYPAIRKALDDGRLLDEALEEHHVVHTLLGELRGMTSKVPRYFAKFKVLSENIRHHVKEEEREMFPEAEDLDLAWDALQQQTERKKEMLLKRLPPSSARKPGSRKRVTRARRSTPGQTTSPRA